MAIWRIRVEMTGVPGAPYLATHYFNAALAGAQESADAVQAFWAQLDAQMHSALTWQIESDVAQLDQATGDITELDSVTTAGGAGTGGSVGMPSATQGLIRWRTGQFVGGREIRGRTFVPGMVQANGEEAPVPGWMDNAASAANTLRQEPGFCIWSKTHGLAPGVQVSSVWTQWAVLRTRRD